MTNEDLLNELFQKNFKNEGITDSEFRERVRVINRTNKKGVNVGNVILEMSKKMRDVVMNEERVYINWRACKVKDFVNVMRCFRCFAFGHMVRECNMKERLCEKCGETGHLKERCKNECVRRNGKQKGRKCDHPVMSLECPEYVRMAERERLCISDD